VVVLVLGLLVLRLLLGSPGEVKARFQGRAKTRALLSGAADSQFELVQLENQQRRVIITNSGVLRYLEQQFRQQDATNPYSYCRTSYQVLLSYGGGGRDSVYSLWSTEGVALHLSSADPAWPTHGIPFRPPIPPAFAEVLLFLSKSVGDVAGTVLILDEEGVRYVQDASLIVK
jgi:hypothetical protein